MTVRYKLTGQDMQTHVNTQWTLGEWKGRIVDQPVRWHWYSFYYSPELAAILNPIHQNFYNPRLFECEVEGPERDDEQGVVVSYMRARLLRELEFPVCTSEQRRQFVVTVALARKYTPQNAKMLQQIAADTLDGHNEFIFEAYKERTPWVSTG